MIFGKHINKYYLKYSYFFILGIIALVFVDIFQLRIPEIIGEIVDYIKESKLTMELLNGYVKEFIIVIAVMFIGRFTWRITIFGNGARIEADLRRDLFKKCEQLGQTFYQNNKVGSVMALYTNDIQTMREVFWEWHFNDGRCDCIRYIIICENVKNGCSTYTCCFGAFSVTSNSWIICW